MSAWKQWNLNDQVRFKLTNKGRTFVDELNRSHPVYSKHPLVYAPDSDGWIESSLWQFAYVFGAEFTMGFDLVVETSIELRKS